MTPEGLFSALNVIAVIGWLALLFLPGRPQITRLVSQRVVPTLFAVVYAAVVAVMWSGSSGGFSTLAGVAQLFENRWLLLAGWTHYLAFDLLIGSWEADDARHRGLHHLLLVPCLFLTFMFGPAGWLLYQIVRRTKSTP